MLLFVLHVLVNVIMWHSQTIMRRISRILLIGRPCYYMRSQSRLYDIHVTIAMDEE